jgi:MFS family permease
VLEISTQGEAQEAKARTSVRQSLRASTADNGLSTVLSNITGGVLLSNFLLDLGATPIQIGMLNSLPMLTHLLQPLGALLSNRTNSRHKYGLWIFLPARLLWLLLLADIIFVDRYHGASKQLVSLTLVLLSASNILAALGSASWMSWLAALVPPTIRGRYYGIRNIAAGLANLICLPIGSFIISHWRGSETAGYGIVLGIGIVAGLGSLGCQQFMIDVNPQDYQSQEQQEASWLEGVTAALADSNLVILLIYFAIWAFAINLSTPFFNFYMLENLHVELTSLALFSSLGHAANTLMLLVWGPMIDRVGSRPVLILAGLVLAMMPLFWLLTNRGPVQTHLWICLVIFHLIWGGIWAAADLGNTNIQIAIVPIEHHATFFALAAAVVGVCGALGTTVGGFMIQQARYEGILGVFAISAILRLVAIGPLLLVKEQRAARG